MQASFWSSTRTLFAGLALLVWVAPASAAQLGGGGRARTARSLTLASPPIVLDFENEDDFVTPLANGQALTSPPEFGRLVRLSASGANAGAAIFDSTPGGPNDPSQDRDLLVGRGNVLILQNSQATTQATPGIFDHPNDDQDGGDLVLRFVGLERPLNLVLIDIDSGTQQASRVTLTDGAGRTRTYTVPPRWTEDLLNDGPPGWRRLDLTTLAPQPGFASSATATQQTGFDGTSVAELRVHLGSSGAIDDVTLAPGETLGMTTLGERATFFDPDQGVVLGSVSTPPTGHSMDCAIARDGRFAFATDFANELWVYDLTVTPPALAAGTNPIPISQPGQDLSFSPDQRFLAVGGSGAPFPLSLVDPLARAEVRTLSAPLTDFCCVDFCRDDLLLTGSHQQSRFSSVRLAPDGTPSFTGESLPLPTPWNVFAAPGGRAGIALSQVSFQFQSFRVDGMVPVSTRVVPEVARDVAFMPDGQRFFLRGFDTGYAFTFEPLTGVIGAAPLFSFPVGQINNGFGVDSVAVHPDGTRLFVVDPTGVSVRSTSTGGSLGSIAISSTAGAGGIAVIRIAR